MLHPFSPHSIIRVTHQPCHTKFIFCYIVSFQNTVLCSVYIYVVFIYVHSYTYQQEQQQQQHSYTIQCTEHYCIYCIRTVFVFVHLYILFCHSSRRLVRILYFYILCIMYISTIYHRHVHNFTKQRIVFVCWRENVMFLFYFPSFFFFLWKQNFPYVHIDVLMYMYNKYMTYTQFTSIV